MGAAPYEGSASGFNRNQGSLILADAYDEGGFAASALELRLGQSTAADRPFGDGDGYGYGNGDGYGNGYGYGNGNGYGNGDGNGYGNGYGYGYGNGDGYG